MSAEFLRFWRYIQRFSFGALFSWELVILFVNKKELYQVIDKFLLQSSKTTSVITSAIFLFMIILISGMIGALLIDIIVSLFSSLGRSLFSRIKPFSKYYKSNSISDISVLLRTDYEISLDLLRTNLDTVIRHLNLRSLSEPELSESKQTIKNYYKQVKSYINEIQSYELFGMLGYTTTLTQEQRTIENLRWDIQNVYALWVTALTAGIIYLQFDSFSTLKILLVFGIFMVIILATLPYLFSSRKSLAFFTLATFSHIYMLGEAADLADRDAI